MIKMLSGKTTIAAIMLSACRADAPPSGPPSPLEPPAQPSNLSETLPAGCLNASSHSESKGRTGIYERHEDVPTGNEIWQYRATGLVASGSELAEFIHKERFRLDKVKGVNGHFIALCCAPSAQYQCLAVTALKSDLDTEQLAQELAVIFSKANQFDYDVIVVNEGPAH